MKITWNFNSDDITQSVSFAQECSINSNEHKEHILECHENHDEKKIMSTSTQILPSLGPLFFVVSFSLKKKKKMKK